MELFSALSFWYSSPFCTTMETKWHTQPSGHLYLPPWQLCSTIDAALFGVTKEEAQILKGKKTEHPQNKDQMGSKCTHNFSVDFAEDSPGEILRLRRQRLSTLSAVPLAERCEKQHAHTSGLKQETKWWTYIHEMVQKKGQCRVHEANPCGKSGWSDLDFFWGVSSGALVWVCEAVKLPGVINDYWATGTCRRCLRSLGATECMESYLSVKN